MYALATAVIALYLAPNQRYGNYLAGLYANGVVLVLTKQQALASLSYECDSPLGVRMIFGNKWYCYTMFTSGIPQDYTTISRNYCARLQKGSSVIKLTDKTRECGFINMNRGRNGRGHHAFLGLVLPKGAKKSAAAFKYFDGSAPGALPWVQGSPANAFPGRNLVICGDHAQWGKITDVPARFMSALICKKLAKRLPSLPRTTPKPRTTAKPTTKPSTRTTPKPRTTAKPTTKTPAGCEYPTNSSQAGLVVGKDYYANLFAPEIGFCSCDIGKKSFYNSGNTSIPYTSGNAVAKVVIFPNETPENPECADFCVIDEAGNECSFSNTSVEMLVEFMPYCVNGKCHMYVTLGPLYVNQVNPDTLDVGLICGSTLFSLSDGLNVDGSHKPMDPDTSPQAYVHAAAFTCKGCAAIRNSSCLRKMTAP